MMGVMRSIMVVEVEVKVEVVAAAAVLTTTTEDVLPDATLLYSRQIQ